MKEDKFYMNYEKLRQDNGYHTWFKYQPMQAEVDKYVNGQSSILIAGFKIVDVYYTFAYAKQLFQSAGCKEFGELCDATDESRHNLKSNFLVSAIIRYGMCIDLARQVIWAYIQPGTFGAFVCNNSRDYEAKCTSKNVERRLNELIDEGNINLQALEIARENFENDKKIVILRDLYHYLKHRGTIYFRDYEKNIGPAYVTSKGKEIEIMKRKSYTYREIEEILWNFNEAFQKHFNEIIDLIIPEDYLASTINREIYIDKIVEVKKKS